MYSIKQEFNLSAMKNCSDSTEHPRIILGVFKILWEKPQDVLSTFRIIPGHFVLSDY